MTGLDVRRDWDKHRDHIRTIAEHVGEWAGIPIPLPDFDLHVEPSYPFAPFFDGERTRRAERACSAEDMEMRVRNSWWDRTRRRQVTLYQRGEHGRVEALVEWRVRGAAERLTYWLTTAGAAEAWDEACEARAQEKLATLIRPHLMKMYRLTGAFLETSPRSGVTYVLRRGRPTVALRGRRDDEDARVKILAVLCLHPIAWYSHPDSEYGTWAGAMVPTDDVIAHLLWIRGDERGFWARANQHDPESPEAGL